MKLYHTIMAARDISFKLVISPRLKKNANPLADNPLLEQYTSKAGKRSLIFNPTIAIQITKNVITEYIQPITIPINLVTLIGTMISSVRDVLIKDEELYITDPNNRLTMNKTVAIKNTRKISIFTTYLTIGPGITNDKNENPTPAIMFGISDTVFGYLFPNEVQHLLYLINHIDLLSISLTSSMCDMMAKQNEKLDYLVSMVEDIKNNMGLANTQKSQINSPVDNINNFDWKVSDGFYE